jgi:hypothetical protein
VRLDALPGLSISTSRTGSEPVRMGQLYDLGGTGPVHRPQRGGLAALGGLPRAAPYMFSPVSMRREARTSAVTCL